MKLHTLATRCEELSIKREHLLILLGKRYPKILHWLAIDYVFYVLQRIISHQNESTASLFYSEHMTLLSTIQDWFVDDKSEEEMEALWEEIEPITATRPIYFASHSSRIYPANLIDDPKHVIARACELVMRMTAGLSASKKEPRGKKVYREETQWLIQRTGFLARVWATCGVRSRWLLREGLCPVEEPEHIRVVYHTSDDHLPNDP